MKHPAILLLTAACLTTACHTSRTTASSQQSTHDTVETLQLRYDSVFVLHDRRQDYRRARPSDTLLLQPVPDTVDLHHTRVEYRLRLMRDTLRLVHRDTVVHTVVQEPAPYRVPWYDRAARLIAVAFFIALALAMAFPQNKS